MKNAKSLTRKGVLILVAGLVVAAGRRPAVAAPWDVTKATEMLAAMPLATATTATQYLLFSCTMFDNMAGPRDRGVWWRRWIPAARARAANRPAMEACLVNSLQAVAKFVKGFEPVPLEPARGNAADGSKQWSARQRDTFTVSLLDQHLTEAMGPRWRQLVAGIWDPFQMVGDQKQLKSETVSFLPKVVQAMGDFTELWKGKGNRDYFAAMGQPNPFKPSGWLRRLKRREASRGAARNSAPTLGDQ